MKTDIATIEQMNPIDLFQGEKLDPILSAIKKEVTSEVPDASTVKGRERIKSLAHRVARTKTTLDEMGKNLVSEWKAKSKLVDASRKHARDFLDQLKEDIREPLTAWEKEESNRVDNIQSRIAKFRELSATTDTEENYLSAEQLKANLVELKKVPIDKSFDEFSNEAAQEKDQAITKLEDGIARQEMREAEAKELENLRVEAETRKQAERYAAIAQEAADKARREEQARAEVEVNKAKAEKEEAERKATEAVQALVRQAEEADKAKIEAVEQEKRRAIEEASRATQEKERREADLKHRKEINNEALKCFKKGGLNEESSKLAIELIAKKLVAHISINY